MKVTFSFVVFCTLLVQLDGCATHQPAPSIPQTFIGTVGQGCTPTTIATVTDLVTDPTKCDLGLYRGCDLCKLNLYLPETTTSRFLVQPLLRDTFVDDTPHVEGTECKCSDGCYFHRSSITQLGIEPLPSGTDGTVGSFSEPFACFSGTFMPTLATAPTYTYLIWCENDGGCPNDLVARYSFLIRFELSSPNRPPVKDTVTPKVTSLPETSCLKVSLPARVRKFLKGKGSMKGGEERVIIESKFSCKTGKAISRCVSRCLEIS